MAGPSLKYGSSHLYAAVRLELHGYRKVDAGSITGSGTGFILNGFDRERKFLVTNRHVLDPAFRGKPLDQIDAVTVTRYQFNNPDKPRLIEIPDVRATYSEEDEDLDLAIIDLTENRVPENALPSFFSALDLVTPSDIERENVGVGSEIVMAGYPAVGGQAGARPILVPGLVSTDLRYDANYGANVYPGKGLCHAFSRGGMSGAPIFTMLSRKRFDKRPPEPQIGILGINVGHLKSDLGEPSAISLFLPSLAIVRLMKQMGDRNAELWSML